MSLSATATDLARVRAGVTAGLRSAPGLKVRSSEGEGAFEVWVCTGVDPSNEAQWAPHLLCTVTAGDGDVSFGVSRLLLSGEWSTPKVVGSAEAAIAAALAALGH